jgi:hypothetical protein
MVYDMFAFWFSFIPAIAAFIAIQWYLENNKKCAKAHFEIARLRETNKP